MVYTYVNTVVENVKGMHLIFPAETESQYLDHLHQMKRHSTWVFVVGFFFPLLTSEIMLLSHLSADGSIDLPIGITVRLATTLLLFLVSAVVCLNCFGQVNREGVWFLIFCGVLATLTFRHAHGDEASGTGVLLCLLVVLGFGYLPLRIPTGLFLLLLVSSVAGIASATGINDIRRSEVGMIMSLTVAAVRILALLEASQRRDWLQKNEEGESSFSTDKGSFQLGSGNALGSDRSSPTQDQRQDSRTEHCPPELPGQMDEASQSEPHPPGRSKEKRRTYHGPLRMTRAGSIHSNKEKRSANTGEGHLNSRRPRRRSEGVLLSESAQRLSIDELKDMVRQPTSRPFTIQTPREVLDPTTTSAAAMVEPPSPKSPRRYNKQKLAFADDEGSKGSLSLSDISPTPKHSPGIHPHPHPSTSSKRSISPVSECRILSVVSAWEDYQVPKRTISRQSGGFSGPLSYSQSSGSLESSPPLPPAIAHVACQTDMIWKEGSWHCTRCARPPNLPGGLARSDSKGKLPERSKSQSAPKQRLKAAMEMVGRLQGTWRLIYGPENVSPWLQEFTIYRTDVFAQDVAKRLDFVESVRVVLAGGELTLDNEEYLHRHGRSGQHLMFERLEDDFDFGDENVFVRQSSVKSTDSDITCGGAGLTDESFLP